MKQRAQSDERHAVGFALIAAVTAGAVAMARRGPAHPWSDFSRLPIGASALVAGLNPYHASPAIDIPLVYPLPAVLLALPFSWLPTVPADGLFSAIGMGVLAYAHAMTGPIERPAIVAFCSAALAQNVFASQWPSLLLGAMLLSRGTITGALFACKPTTALWLFAARPAWRVVLGAAVVFALSVAIRPRWPVEWWATANGVLSYAVVPALLPFGFLIVLATMLRWRLPEARLLLVMCCVPHQTFFYETLPLLVLVPKTWGEAWLLCASSWACYAIHSALMPPHAPMAQAMRLGGLLELWGIYAPCAAMLFSRRNALVMDVRGW